MKDLAEYLIKSIVERPDQVVVEENTEGDFVSLFVKTHPDDLKIVIGRHGQTIRAIRHLLNARALVEKKRARLEIKE